MKRGLYKVYEDSPELTIPSRTQRRHKRQILDGIISGEGEVPHCNPEPSSVSVPLVDLPRFDDTLDEENCCSEPIPLSSSDNDSSSCDGGESNLSDASGDITSVADNSVPSYSSDSLDVSWQQVVDAEDKNIQSDDTVQVQRDNRPDVENQDHIFTPSAYQALDDDQVIEEEQLSGELPEKLCDCTSTTEGEALLMVLALGKRHSLSWLAMVDVLKLINVLFRKQVVPETKYFLLKHTEPDRSDEIFHVYCPKCQSYLEGYKKHDADRGVRCSCGHYIPSLKAASSFFMTLGLKQQMIDPLQTPEVAENLDYRFTRKKIVDSNIEDFFDGAFYRKLSQPGQPLADKLNYSYSFNTDGCPVGRSSFQQVWPLYVALDALPPKLRSKYMVLAGIWVSKSEPNMQVFLQTFVEEANELAEKGVQWRYSGKVVTSKLIPLCCVVDSMARWQLLNMKMFNGYFGCTMCLHPGDPTDVGVRYGLHKEVPQERTDASLRRDMLAAFEKNRASRRKKEDVHGCRGISGLYNMSHIDLSASLVADYMHFLKGVVEQHVNNFLGPYSARYFIDPHSDNVATLSERLLSLSPPSVITRDPRSLSDLAKWQASELRAFLVLYAPIVFHNVIEHKYVVHFCLLSCAIHILLQKSLSRSQIKFASDLIIMYIILYEKYFTLEQMTFNIHLLTHVIKGVSNFGPLWTHNCFPYEGENHFILLLKKCASQVAKEIVRKHRVFKNLPLLCQKFNAGDAVVDFCEGLFHRQLRHFLRTDNVVLMGTGKNHILSEEEVCALNGAGLGDEGVYQCMSFDRLLYGGMKLCTASYCQTLKKDDSGMFLKTGAKCKLVSIVKLSSPDSHKVVLFAKRAVEDREPLFRYKNLTMQHIKLVRNFSDIVALSPSEVAGQCIFMKVDNKLFVNTIPYGFILGD